MKNLGFKMVIPVGSKNLLPLEFRLRTVHSLSLLNLSYFDDIDFLETFYLFVFINFLL